MIYDVKTLTAECRPKLYERVLMWRADSCDWEKNYLNAANEHWIGNPDWAYTHWVELPPSLPRVPHTYPNDQD